MKAFDPGGAPHPHAGGQRMALRHSQTTTSPESGSPQFLPRREFFCSHGLKAVIFLEDAEKRVLCSTRRATHYFIVSIAQVFPFLGPSKLAHLPPVLKTAEQFINSRDNSNTSDASVCNPVNGAGGMEERGFIPVDVLCRGHNEIKTTMSCGYVQPEQENFGHLARSFDGFLLSSSHPEASFQCSSKSLSTSYDSALTNLTSSQAVKIPRALALHISCHDDVRHLCGANEACIENPEGPSTPDLQPEVRARERGILCAAGADGMLPLDNLLLESESVMSTCMVQCPMGPTDCLDTLMEQGKDACGDYGSLSGISSIFCDYRERAATRRHTLRKPKSTAHGRYMVQRLFYCFKISALSFCAAPNKRKSHLQSLLTLRFRLAQQKLVRLLKGKEGEVICEQLLADILGSLQAYKQRFLPYRNKGIIEASTAACHSRRRAYKQIHSIDKAYAGRNGHHKKVNMEMQEQVLDMLQAFSHKYLAGNCWPLERLSLEQDDQGIYRTNQCSSILSSKIGIDSASKPPISLEVKDARLPMRTELSSEVMDDGKEDFTESHRIVKKVDDWNSIPVDQVGECLDTCLSDLQLRPSFFCSDVTPQSKLLDIAVRKIPSEASNMECSSGNRIDESFQQHVVCVKGNRNEESCLPLPPVDGPHSHTPSLCISSSSFSTEELRSSMPRGGVHERQSKEKLEHFAEGFLLRRHIIQQQRRAQQAPPFPPRDSVQSAVDDKGTRRRLLADVRTNPYTYLSMQASITCPEVENHEPAMILASSLTKPCNEASSFCDRDGFVGADVVIDIVGLVKYIESNCGQLETSTDAGANSISYAYMPLPNVSDVIVTIVTFVVYTKILLEGALAWLGARTHSKEED